MSFKNPSTEKMDEMLTAENTPIGWVSQPGSDFHVSIFKDHTPNSLIFAPKFNTIELLDDCVFSATMAGKKLVLNKICKAFDVTYLYEKNTGIWTHIKLNWEIENE